MTKQRTPGPITDGDAQPWDETDTATTLIYKLSEFYNRHPDHKTTLLEINILMRLAYQEMAKFIKQPHTQVTQIYFDSSAPNVHSV